MIGVQVKCFRVGPWIATPWDLRQKIKKKKQQKQPGGSGEGEQRRTLGEKPASYTTLDKFLVYIKSLLGS